ncbi:DciA family protein [Hahella aquimaris]|uniref:DciA family protein n=1 Tax=Hahella sp. HNIBRBA332 TaxID=3015983 RepID=UPI00273B59DB|nr:DciA family protein [Hahella sp. HNIBRBA332]WLQ14109.1 DciA family protein [Hahella sp. HNIBRBA332]
MPDRDRKLGDILSSSSPALESLFHRALQLDKLQKIFSQCLPPHLRNKVTLSSVKDGVIRVTVPDAVTATQLRMNQHTSLPELRKHKDFDFAYQFKIRVEPTEVKAKIKRKAKPISQKNAELLRQEAQLCDDPELKKALEALSTHTAD